MGTPPGGCCSNRETVTPSSLPGGLVCNDYSRRKTLIQWKSVTAIPDSVVKNLPFEKRLAIGKRVEQAVLDIIKRHDPDAFIQDGLDKGKDIVSPKYKLLLEVKSQPDAVFCVSVEIGREYPGKPVRPSGITTSQADYYVWHCQHKLFIIKTTQLRQLIAEIPVTKHPLHGEQYHLKILKISILEANCVKIIKYDDDLHTT